MRLTAVSCVLALLLLTGCGVKPGAVDPPQGAAQDHFPKTYPDPSTDHVPESYLRR